MNIITTLTFIFALCFGILDIIFALLKEKGASLVSIFNSFSEEEKLNYNKKLLTLDIRNRFLFLAYISFFGNTFSYFRFDFFGIISLIICAIIFLKHFNLDPHKAFEKYKIK